MQIDRFRNAYTSINDVTDISQDYLQQVEGELEGQTEEDYDSELRSNRYKRSIDSDSMKMKTSHITSEADTDFLSELNCGLTQCTFISCVIGPLAKKEFTLFKVKSRLWVRTLNEIQRNDIEISSKLVSRVTKLPYGVNPSYLGYQTHVVTTQVTGRLFAFKFFANLNLV